MERPIRFKFSPQKAWAAIHWMLSQSREMDLHTILKACYFADKAHLNKYGRPIFGATYRAMKFGPVPIEIYEMVKSEPLWLAEIDAKPCPWRLNGFLLSLCGNEAPDLNVFSKTDFEELQCGFARSRSMTFNERTAATHGYDWQAAELGYMRYEDMIDDSASKGDLVQYLRENSKRIRI